MGGMSRSGVLSVGRDFQTQHMGNSVSDSRSVSCNFTTTDHVNNLPTLILESCQSSYVVVGQASPIWFPMEISHPCAQLSSYRAALIQGEGGARDSDVSRKASFNDRLPPTEPSGAFNYFIAACILLNMSQWSSQLLNMSQWSSQSSQRALITNSGAYLCQFTAKLLKNFCFEPRSAALCWYAMEFV